MTTDQTAPTRLGQTNPWLTALWIFTAIVGLIGMILTNTHSDSTAPDFDPTTAAVGHTLLGASAVMLAVMLAAYAICWQMRRP